MIAELGQFSLILAFLAALLGCCGLLRAGAAWQQVAHAAARAQFMLVAVAFGLLTTAFVLSDFSVLLVTTNSHTLKPLLYKITGVWGNHEGSLLLWVLVLAFCGILVSLFEKRLPPADLAAVLGVLSLVCVAFMALSLFTSNPFTRLMPPPLDGQDLNPLLQDPGLAFHPPLLYVGYVGGAISFAVAVAALWQRPENVRAFAPVLRTWALFAWVFLTAGLVLGSWWAYYELGWGGWWFWDPVENAALVPWLTGTALLHSVRVLEVRGTLLRWTLLLAIITFGLGMLGTFLVRSGVLTSVHAFAADPLRGLAILAAFALLLGGALALLAARWPRLGAEAGIVPVSREGVLLFNNILLAVSAATVLLGTLYPLIIDALRLPPLTVGPPYFNATFIPLMLPLLAIAAVGQGLKWGKGQAWATQQHILLGCMIAMVAVLTGGLMLLGWQNWLALLGFASVAVLLAGTVYDMRRSWFVAADRFILSGKWLAHIGLAVTVLGISGTALGTEQIVKMHNGSKTSFAGYEITYQGHTEVPVHNYVAERALLIATKPNKPPLRLEPERRYYPAADQMTTEAAIYISWRGDLFATIGITQPDGGKSVRLRWNPLQMWIWVGCTLMALGGLLAMGARRRA